MTSIIFFATLTDYSEFLHKLLGQDVTSMETGTDWAVKKAKAISIRTAATFHASLIVTPPFRKRKVASTLL